MTSEQLGGGLGPDAMPGPPPIDQGMPPMGQGMPPMGQDMPPMQPMTPPHSRDDATSYAVEQRHALNQGRTIGSSPRPCRFWGLPCGEPTSRMSKARFPVANKGQGPAWGFNPPSHWNLNLEHWILSLA